MHICGGDRLCNHNFRTSVTLTLHRVIWHTVMYRSSTSTYISHFVQIGKNGWTDRQMDGRTYGQTDMYGWVIEQSFTSPPTQYRLYGRRFYRSKKNPTNSIKVLNEEATKEKPEKGNNKIHIYIRNSTR